MKKDEERAGKSEPSPGGVLQSHGEDEARAYAKGEVAPRPLNPTMEMETVWIEDPRRVPAAGKKAKVGSGPRNPEQRAPLTEKNAPSIETPEGLPVTKLQPIVIDPELLAEWHTRPGEGEGGALAVRAPARPIVVKVEAPAARSGPGKRAKAAWWVAVGLAVSGALGALGVRCGSAERAARRAESEAAKSGTTPAHVAVTALGSRAEPRGEAPGREAEELGGGVGRGAVSSVAVASARRPAGAVRARPAPPAPRSAPPLRQAPAREPAAPTTTAPQPVPTPAISPEFFNN